MPVLKLLKGSEIVAFTVPTYRYGGGGRYLIAHDGNGHTYRLDINKYLPMIIKDTVFRVELKITQEHLIPNYIKEEK